jgi:endonuclease/exonuclease/phosphatase (EEP) superfamily protein YafD
VALGLALLRSRASLVALLLAAWQGWVWWDVPGARPLPDCAGLALSVAAFNLQASNETPDRAVAALRAMAPDILMVAENWGGWGRHLAPLALDYPSQSPTDWQTAERPTIFAKFPVLERETIRPFAGDMGGDPFATLAATIFSYERALLDLGEGRRATVVAVHAPYPLGTQVAALRHRYLRHLAASLAAVEGPLILLGDFNVTPWSPDYRDLVAEAGLASASGGHIATWPVWSPLLRIPIDHVFIRGPWSRLRAARGPDLGSDHYPILADLCLS